MELTNFIHKPSMFFIGLACMIGFIVGGKDYKKSILTIRDISLLMGISGTLVSFVHFLAEVNDIVMLRPLMSVAILPSIYALISVPLLHTLSSYMPKEYSEKSIENNQYLRATCAISLIYIVPILIGIYYEVLNIYLNRSAIMIILLLIIIPGLFDRTIYNHHSNLTSKCISIRQFSIYAMIIGLLISWTGLLMSNGDPKQLGPQMAISVLTLLYSGSLYISATILYRSLCSTDIPHQGMHQYIYLMLTILCLLSCLTQMWLKIWY